MLYIKKINLKNKNDSFSQIYKLINPKSVCLDVGCATGGLSLALAKNKSCSVSGLELNPKSVEECKKLGVFNFIQQYDLNLLNTEDFPQFIEAFDYIICADVLEHLINPSKTVQVLKKFLKPSGNIIISLPNISHASIKTNLLLDDFTYTEIGILDKTHLHFYTAKSIAEMLSSLDLKIKQVNFVMFPLDGWQPHKISELPKTIADFISKDKHSHVLNYIISCKKETCSSKQNLKKIETALQQTNIKKSENLTFKIKRCLVCKLSFLLKYLEYLKK
ncbi:MAG: class I SAM-dependent methyltransferase [Alphaproteobacteria bacterium]|nr:class I SAM-dependent methyltransferase [Alphaproteobacteria bacterium]